jgi:hypothetical protein
MRRVKLLAHINVASSPLGVAANEICWNSTFIAESLVYRPLYWELVS